MASSPITLFCLVLSVAMRAPWWACILATVASYILAYYTIKHYLWKYVIFRIKPLYQLLLSKDIITSKLSETLRKKVNSDIVDDIQENLDHLLTFGDSEIERLKKREQERSDFLGAIAHEIRTPIFNIQGYAEALINGGLEDTEVNRKFIDRILRSINRLSGLIEDIDKVSYYESGGVVIEKEPFDIVELIHEITDTNIILAAKYNIRFKVNTGTFSSNHPLIVYADRLRIGQVLNNIVMNAITFSNDGGVVEIGFVDMFDKILVEVTDKGKGIPPQDLPRIFNRLYRVDKSRSRSQGGLGLGLSMVKAIIDTHNENITVRSKVGEGTTFSFTLSKQDSRQQKSA